MQSGTIPRPLLSDGVVKQHLYLWLSENSPTAVELAPIYVYAAKLYDRPSAMELALGIEKSSAFPSLWINLVSFMAKQASAWISTEHLLGYDDD